MLTMSEQATRLASRPTAGWWDEAVRAEIRYAVFRHRAGHDPAIVWPHLEHRLTSLGRLKERNEAA